MVRIKTYDRSMGNRAERQRSVFSRRAEACVFSPPQDREIYAKRICSTYNRRMGIVKISDQMHENLRVASTALSRSINSQAEHWMRVGMLTEMYPDLDHREICQMLVRAELAGGLDIALAARGELDSKPAADARSPRSRKQPH